MARLRCLRAVVHLLTGPRGERLATSLHQAERDEAALGRAAKALAGLAPVDRRRVLASYAVLM